tara:strand:- start:435 stop:827 length:393 start_codon:yes stop_codon:yes gene_type:complete
LADLVPVGIKMPFRGGKQGYFAQTYSDMERALNNLKMLLMTAKGERPLMPTYGSDLREILFESNTEGFTDDLIEDAVKEAVELWMPEALIISVEVVRDLVNNPSQATVLIKFSVINIPDSTQELTLGVSA